MAGQVVVAESELMERAYLAHRDDVLTMLRASFTGVSDLEELYQEAWTEMLEMQARGQTINDIAGLLRTIAWRRGRDRLRKRQPTSLDPTSYTIASQTDTTALPDETVEIELDAALIWQVVDSLDPRDAAVIKLRFGQHLNSREIQRELGVSSKRLEKIVSRAYSQVEDALTAHDGEESDWRRRQRSLLLACELGLASARQRRQAKRMVSEDPGCRAMLAEIRSTLEGVAAILPLPLLTSDGTLGLVAHLKLELADRFNALREAASEFVSRTAAHGSSLEQAGAGGAASVGGGLALKAALTCVAVTGTAVICVTAGVFDKPEPKAPAPPRAPQPEKASLPPVRIQPVRVTRPVVIQKKPAQTRQPEPVAKVAAAPPPSPAPPASTEFGPGVVGSASASPTAAAAPDNGSGEFAP